MTRELVGGVAAIVIGAGYLAMTLQIRASALADTVGPAGFPRTLAYAMIGLGIILCAQALLARRAKAPGAEPAIAVATDGTDAEESCPGLAGITRAAGMLGLGIVYLTIVRYVGYVAAIAALIVAVALYQGTAPSWRVVGIGIAGALVYWLIFVWLLGIPLPAGVFADLF